MSNINPNEQDKSPATSPEGGELDADELDKVSGGMKPITRVAKKMPGVIADPCEGGQ